MHRGDDGIGESLSCLCNRRKAKSHTLSYVRVHTNRLMPAAICAREIAVPFRGLGAEIVLEEGIHSKLLQTGAKAKLKQILKEKLEECGWKDQIRALAQEGIHSKDDRVKTVEQLVGELRPRGRALVPDAIKADLLRRLRLQILS